MQHSVDGAYVNLLEVCWVAGEVVGVCDPGALVPTLQLASLAAIHMALQIAEVRARFRM